MVKDSGGVAMLKDVTDWRPPRRHDGVIILSPPKAATPPSPMPPSGRSDTAGSESPLPQAQIASPGIRRAGEYDTGVVTSADCGPWTPPRPQGGLIVEGRWIDLPHPPDASAPSEDKRNVAGGAPKRRIRKR
jgi:hypothetical protein